MNKQDQKLNDVRDSSSTILAMEATTEYHRAKDIFHVKNFLGHKSVKNTGICINIERKLFDDSNDGFTVEVLEKPE